MARRAQQAKRRGKKRTLTESLEARDKLGRWNPGVSGNLSGRPRKERTQPKSLTDQITEAMSKTVEVVDVQGKCKHVPIGEAAVLAVVAALPGMKPKDCIDTLKWLHGFPGQLVENAHSHEPSVVSEQEMRAGLSLAILEALEFERDRLRHQEVLAQRGASLP